MPPTAPDDHAIAIHLDKLLADRGMTLTELSDRVGVSVVKLSILKNGRARAIRFSTLTRLARRSTASPATCLLISTEAARTWQPSPDAPDAQRATGTSWLSR